MSTPIFARHETFHPRYGWIKKGFDAAKRDSRVFVRDDAHVVLGVGKNMVRSIRYWSHAFKVLQDDPDATGRQRESIPTSFGEFLLGQHGVDRYLEDLGSLWLLHWQLLKEPSTATAWRYAFFLNGRAEISSKDLTAQLADYVEAEFPTARTAKSSLAKDAACILRMYGELPTGKDVSEESIHCPFAELGLLRPTSDGKRYAFRVGPKAGLSSDLITGICLDYTAASESAAQTVALTRLLRGEGSPGLALRLREADLYGALEEVAQRETAVELTEAAGVIQLSFSDDPAALSRRLLIRHFDRETVMVAA
jgi:hypothetical protein